MLNLKVSVWFLEYRWNNNSEDFQLCTRLSDTHDVIHEWLDNIVWDEDPGREAGFDHRYATWRMYYEDHTPDEQITMHQVFINIDDLLSANGWSMSKPTTKKKPPKKPTMKRIFRRAPTIR
jgi:hypothetical protein